MTSSTPARISIFGLGYVGCVSATNLAAAGNTVVGVELVPEKVDAINSGSVPLFEPGLAELAALQVEEKRLSATADTTAGILATDISFVCVGTPSLPSEKIDLSAIEAVCRDIGKAIAQKETRHVVIIRSTVLPGTCDRCVEVIAEASGKSCPEDFAVVSNPEFLREGTALKDYEHPPFTVVGASRPEDAQIVGDLYAHIDAPLFLTDLRTAETIKYACNLFHATKVCFANEIGRICKSLEVDSHAVMEIFCADDKLNLSPYYLKPGYAFGGSCLPKDLRAIMALSREHHVALPMLERILESNRQQVELAIKTVLATGKQKIGMLGFSFKPDTDDLRESPHVALAEALIGRGKNVMIFDPHIQTSRLMGSNRKFIDEKISHVSELMVGSLDEVIESSECIVIGNKDAHYEGILDRVREDQIVIDLVRIDKERTSSGGYHGLSW